MEQVQTDPNKDAIILAVSSALAGTVKAAEAVCELSEVLPVYFANQPSLESVVTSYLQYITEQGPMPEWLEKAQTP